MHTAIDERKTISYQFKRRGSKVSGTMIATEHIARLEIRKMKENDGIYDVLATWQDKYGEHTL
jgi:hypothetical protein